MASRTPLVLGPDGRPQQLQGGDTLAGVGGDRLAPLASAEVSVTAATTLTGGAFGTQHVCSGTASDYTVTLPSPTGNAGKAISLRMAAGLTKLVTVDAGAGVLIDGQRTRVLWAKESCDLYCDGSNWEKVGGRTIPMFVKLQRQGASESVSSSAYKQATLDTCQVGLAGMFDAANGRAAILRPGTYETAGFGYAITGQVAVGVALNAAQNNSATNTGYSTTPAASAGGAVFQNTFVAAAGDYIALWYYGFAASTVLGATPGSNAQLVVTEVPTW